MYLPGKSTEDNYCINSLNEVLKKLDLISIFIKDQDQKQWIAEAISNLQTVRNKLNE